MTNESSDLLLELCKEQLGTLRFINKIMFDATTHQRSLKESDKNMELLELAWATNDYICDNPKQQEIIKKLKEKFGIVL